MLIPTKAILKSIKSLHLKKNRDKNNCFIVEGDKLLQEVINNSFKSIKEIFSTDDTFNKLSCDVYKVSEKELQQISALKTPNNHLAVVTKVTNDLDENSFFNNGIHLVLDEVKDPGNLGTIIRIADWFGIKSIICSENTVDIYNPKVVQSSMGAIFRIPVFYKDLSEFLNTHKSSPIFVTDLNGDNLYNNDYISSENGIVIMGSESHGVSEDVKSYANYKIKIPSYGGAESLNVAVATGIICAEFRRRV